MPDTSAEYIEPAQFLVLQSEDSQGFQIQVFFNIIKLVVL